MADMREPDRRRGARDSRHAVMFGHPIAMIAQRLGMAREVGRIGERLRDRPAVGDGDEVEEGEFQHAGRYAVGVREVQGAKAPPLQRRGLQTMPARPSANPSAHRWRSEEHTSELQSLMRISYAVFCLKKQK